MIIVNIDIMITITIKYNPIRKQANFKYIFHKYISDIKYMNEEEVMKYLISTKE